MDAALATWVPTPVLVGALTIVVSALYKMVRDRFKKMEDTQAKSVEDADKRQDKFQTMIEAKFDKMATAISKIENSFNDLDKKLMNVVTRDMLGSMGDRFDGRLAGAFQEIGSNKADARSGIDVLRSEISNVRDELGNLREELRSLRDR